MPFTGDSFSHLFDWEKDPQRQEKIVNARLEAEFDGVDTGLSAVAARTTVLEANLGTTTNDDAAAGEIGENIQTQTGNANANSTVTMTIASPCVVTWTAHKFTVGACTTAIKFSNSGGALPTGVVAGTTYYLKAIDANTFNIADSVANALAGTFINTSGSQSGTHTGDIRVFMTNSVVQDVAAISLGAGDWELSGQILTFGSSTTSIIFLVGGISTAAATQDRTVGRLQSLQYGGIVLGNNEFTVFSLGPVRLSLPATTTVYIYSYNAFTVSTSQSAGYLRARRAR
jgi:hypothetical protein